ncbi:hypothetical protein NJH83_28365 [Pseudomonas chlororaphis]|uniref:hypothetical protein n=1 Tax=Pseudomonas chlororaphis TaxID=587753 RepID=UPI00209B8726|nr:hypothetical protein [Pseudomonas chlororaphis]MCO7614158.1 hypothetical protein [Pseudomonas chlororaphis]
MIKGQSIKSIARLIAEAKGANHVMFVVLRDSVTPTRQKEIGIHHLQHHGDSILASDIGKVSNFNTSGKEVKRKDLPLIKKSIPQYRTWKDWHGREHDGIQHRTMDVYPIDFISPPSEKLSLEDINGAIYIATRRIDLSSDPASAMHLANLMLEYFSEFEIFDLSKHKILDVVARQLQWEVLPQGKYPWNKTSDIVTPYLTKLSQSEKGVIEHRMREISKYEPDFLATGRGGYSGYFVYGFTSKKLHFLESIHLNNATYVFGDNWEHLSSLTKEEIINGEHEHLRVIHDKKWTGKIRQMLRA